jgi:hypothetical protein
LSDEDESDVLCGEVVTEQDDDFAAFWACYPRKEARKRAAGLWRRMKAADRAGALTACRHYAAWAAEHPDGVLMIPSTFLSKDGGRWEDWQDGPPPGRDRAPARSGRALDAGLRSIREAWQMEVLKRPSCPRCEADLTVDEEGEHCPICAWRAPPAEPNSPREES